FMKCCAIPYTRFSFLLSMGLSVIAFDLGPKFLLGRVVITRNALAAIPAEEVNAAIHRHSRADWGDLDQHDLAENARCLKEGGRLFSVYRARNGVRFYVITESDRPNVESSKMLSCQRFTQFPSRCARDPNLSIILQKNPVNPIHLRTV